jgi:hypothetical protein
MRPLLLSFLFSLAETTGGNPYPTIGAIPPPAGFRRLARAAGSFGAWLRAVPLKKGLTVYLYNGMPKRNQEAQFAVLDVSVGHEDLQQCADAVMRLRAEYLFHLEEYAAIDFYTEQGLRLNFAQWAAARKVALGPGGQDDRRRVCFDAYLQKVFSYCSTRTLAKQLVPAPYSSIGPGDVLIRSGSPGHAMLVVDVAEDNRGRRVYLLAQSYMPTQDIHIVRDPATGPVPGTTGPVPGTTGLGPGTSGLGPWYLADSAQGVVETPEYTFKTNELRKWSN